MECNKETRQTQTSSTEPFAIPKPMEQKIKNLWSEARDLNLGTTIDRLPHAPTSLQFLRDYVSQNKPCLISSSYTTYHPKWPAISRWAHTPYLLDALRTSTVSLHLTPTGRADALTPHPTDPNSFCFASAAVLPVNFADAISSIDSSNSDLVAYAQQQNDCFRSEYSPLAGDVEPDIPWATEAFGTGRPDAVNLWIGNEKSETSFHKDHYENIYVVVTGRKHFTLVPPTEVHRMYVKKYPAARYVVKEDGGLRLEVEEPERLVPWSSVDPYPRNEEEMERQRKEFPLYWEGGVAFECTVGAGEMLYLPSMWFHHVRQSSDKDERTIAINYWYDMKFDMKYAYFNFLQSIEFPYADAEADNKGSKPVVEEDDSENAEDGAG